VVQAENTLHAGPAANGIRHLTITTHPGPVVGRIGSDQARADDVHVPAAEVRCSYDTERLARTAA